MANHVIDLTGKRFGRLVVIRPSARDKYGSVVWECKCDCGMICHKRGALLRKGSTKSCGCLAREISSSVHRSHGDTGTKLYKMWRGMHDRCKSGKGSHFKNYKNRGITVCTEWEKDYSAFKKWAINNGYTEGLTIDRIDNNKGYSPDNCRLVNNIVQANNKRTNKLIEYDGEIHTIAEWERKIGWLSGTLRDRLRHGWDVERAMTQPKKGETTWASHSEIKVKRESANLRPCSGNTALQRPGAPPNIAGRPGTLQT